MRLVSVSRDWCDAGVSSFCCPLLLCTLGALGGVCGAVLAAGLAAVLRALLCCVLCCVLGAVVRVRGGVGWRVSWP
jgi:hypothetical protein